MKPKEKLINIHIADSDWDNRTFDEKIIIIKEFGKFIEAIRRKVGGI